MFILARKAVLWIRAKIKYMVLIIIAVIVVVVVVVVTDGLRRPGFVGRITQKGFNFGR